MDRAIGERILAELVDLQFVVLIDLFLLLDLISLATITTGRVGKVMVGILMLVQGILLYYWRKKTFLRLGIDPSVLVNAAE